MRTLLYLLLFILGFNSQSQATQIHQSPADATLGSTKQTTGKRAEISLSPQIDLILALGDTIQTLFKVTKPPESKISFDVQMKQVNQKVLSFHIRRLMEILRLLDDHAYYDITDAAYQTTLTALRTTVDELWGPGALKAIYLKARQVRLQDYDVIHILLGQILSHLDGEHRTFQIAFHDVLTCEAAVNARVELFFHINNVIPEGNLRARQGHRMISASLLATLNSSHPKKVKNEARRKILDLIAGYTVTLTDTTIERIRSFIRCPRPGLYEVPSAFIAYALDHPGEHLRTLKSFIQLDFDRNNALGAYLKRADVDPEIMAVIIAEADRFEKEHDRSSIYTAYVIREDADPELTTHILTEARNFKSNGIYSAYLRHHNDLHHIEAILAHVEGSDTHVHETYLKQEYATPQEIETILTHTLRSKNEYYKANTYRAYFTRKDTNPALIKAIMANLRHFQDDYFKASVYAAYLEKEDADPAYIEEILEQTESITDEKHKTPVYTTYIKRPDAKPKTLARIIITVQLNFQNTHYKTLIYKTYLENAGNSLELTMIILLNSQRFNDEDHKAIVYEAYLKQTENNPDIATMMIRDIANFESEKTKASLYQNSLKQADLNGEVVSVIFRDLDIFQTQFRKVSTYAAYLRHKDASANFVVMITEQLQDFTLGYQTAELYRAYINYPNADPALIQQYNMHKIAERYGY